jgi:hypothetical protein
MTGITRQISVIAALVVTIIVNVLATSLPLNGISTGELSDRYPVLTTPAGYVFGIWSVIYIGLIGFAIYQALPRQRERKVFDQIAPAFIVSCVANASWLVLWHYFQVALSVVAMLAILGSLISIYRVLWPLPAQGADHWLLKLPFSIYLGWISVATIVNVSVLGYTLGFTGRGPVEQAIAVVVLAVGCALAIFMALRRGDAAYALVITWAYIGIAVKQTDAQPVVLAAYLFASLAALAAARGWIRGAVPREVVVAR